MYNVAMLKGLGLNPPQPIAPKLMVTDEERRAAQSTLQQVVAPRVILHPGGFSCRRWRSAHYRELVEKLRGCNMGVVLTGSREEGHLFHEEVLKQSPLPSGTLNLMGALLLRELLAVIAESHALVSGSTGPAHMAAACGVPTVSLFDPIRRSMPTRWQPLGNGVVGNGRAERMLARILGNRTNNFIIATKIGWFPGTAANAYEPAHIRHQCEQSLINLKRDYIDLYYFHHGWFGDRDEYLDDAVEVMCKLKDEGKIRLIGQSAYSHKDFVMLIPRVNPDVLQSFANPVERAFIDDENPTRKLMEENQISFIAFRPLYEGLLLDKYKKEDPPQFENGDHRKGLSRFSYESLAKLEVQLNKIKERFGSSTEDLARVAQQYLLHYKFVGAVIPGFRNLRQVQINLSAMDKPLTDEEFEFVKKVFTD